MNFEKGTEPAKKICVVCGGEYKPTDKGKTCSYWCGGELDKQTIQRRTKYSAIEKIKKQSRGKRWTSKKK